MLCLTRRSSTGTGAVTLEIPRAPRTPARPRPDRTHEQREGRRVVLQLRVAGAGDAHPPAFGRVGALRIAADVAGRLRQRNGAPDEGLVVRGRNRQIANLAGGVRAPGPDDRVVGVEVGDGRIERALERAMYRSMVCSALARASPDRGLRPRPAPPARARSRRPRTGVGSCSSENPARTTRTPRCQDDDACEGRTFRRAGISPP